MFIDKARIYVISGRGGNGAVSFRREKFVPKGGPDGGDGGNGGSVIIRATSSMKTLVNFNRKKYFKAASGENGKGSNMHGKSAEDLVIHVPTGTVVKVEGVTIADLDEPGKSVVVAKGGRGGRGNSHFTNSVRQAPTIAENGELGEEHVVELELKVLADVGLVGLPNVGKSSLISAMSNAHPKIADYPFTTLTPVLGKVEMGFGKSYVLVDIPGLIEGAHKGTGLGDEFLRHVERTRVIAPVIDLTSKNHLKNYKIVEEEMEKYETSLIKRPEVIVLNKADLVSEDKIDDVSKLFPNKRVFVVSALTRKGIERLKKALYHEVQNAPMIDSQINEKVENKAIITTASITVEKEGGVFVVKGEKVDRLLHKYQISYPDAMELFMKKIDSLGLEKLLQNAGIKEGDTVVIGDMEFEYRT